MSVYMRLSQKNLTCLTTFIVVSAIEVSRSSVIGNGSIKSYPAMFRHIYSPILKYKANVEYLT